MKLSELKNKPITKVLIYGESGTGKTTACSSFPGPLYYADFDGKIQSAANYLSATNPEKLEQIEVDQFTPQADLGGLRVFQAFTKKLNEFDELVKAGSFPYKTVVIDSLTTFADSMMNDIIRGNPGVKRALPNVPAQQDYLILSVHFKQYIQRILALPCNVVIAAHIKIDKDETTGEVIRRPLLPGQLPEIIPVLFFEVYRQFIERKEDKDLYLWQTGAGGGFKTRTQIIGMPRFVVASYKSIEKANQIKQETKQNESKS